MGVRLGEGATIQPGNDVHILANSIQAVGAPEFFDEGTAPPQIAPVGYKHCLVQVGVHFKSTVYDKVKLLSTRSPLI